MCIGTKCRVPEIYLHCLDAIYIFFQPRRQARRSIRFIKYSIYCENYVDEEVILNTYLNYAVNAIV